MEPSPIVYRTAPMSEEEARMFTEAAFGASLEPVKITFTGLWEPNLERVPWQIWVLALLAAAAIPAAVLLICFLVGLA